MCMSLVLFHCHLTGYFDICMFSFRLKIPGAFQTTKLRVSLCYAKFFSTLITIQVNETY